MKICFISSWEYRLEDGIDSTSQLSLHSETHIAEMKTLVSLESHIIVPAKGSASMVILVIDWPWILEFVGLRSPFTCFCHRMIAHQLHAAFLSLVWLCPSLKPNVVILKISFYTSSFFDFCPRQRMFSAFKAHKIMPHLPRWFVY